LGVHLWAQAVEEAGTTDTPAIRQALKNQRFDAPSGPVRIDTENQHTWKTMRLGLENVRTSADVPSNSCSICWKLSRVRTSLVPSRREGPQTRVLPISLLQLFYPTLCCSLGLKPDELRR